MPTGNRTRSDDENEWRRIANFPGYRINSTGVVLGRRTSGRPLRQWTDKDGYARVTLYCEGRKKHRGVHVLVLEAFAGPRPSGLQASHIDGDPTNNAVGNLAWESVSQNNLRRTDHGRLPLGAAVAVSKLTEDDVREIRRRWTGARGQQTSLGREFGVSRTNIRNIVERRWWKSVQ